MEVVCKKCGQKSRLNNIEKYRGRKVKTRCINSACKSVLEISVPAEEKEETTVVTSFNAWDLNGILKHVSKDGTDGAQYHLKSIITLIGRKSKSSPADIQIDNDNFISRRHCYIQFVEGKGYLIYDNESKNGVKLNDVKLKKEDKIYLKKKDLIQIGNTILQFDSK